MRHSRPIFSGRFRKFAVAAAGIIHAVRNQGSFWVHLPVAVAAIAMGTWLQLESWRWVSLVFAIAMVLSAELMNTAIETLVVVLHPEHDPRIGNALDAAAGAVLITAIAAVIIGLVTMGPPLWVTLANGFN